MIDYKALAERIKKIADGYETSSIADGLRGEIADLRAVVTMLNEMADQEPERFALVPKIPSDEVWQEAESAFHRAGAETFRRPSDMSAIWRDQISAAFRVFASAAPHPSPQPQCEPTEAQIEAWQLLTDLVAGLEATHWSSWQTTAHFDSALDAARAALAAKE